jgi:hypothetical protein
MRLIFQPGAYQERIGEFAPDPIRGNPVEDAQQRAQNKV